ncbi:MAG: hypothetical protein NDI61_06700 [Bdellovibrionaceae bacterium]|nr:hypothetical protein [Pseudobdellovibrionaceae bacterium]
MYAILVRLILLAALMDLGMSLSRIEKCDSRMCWDEIQRARLKVLKVEWRPISVFPESVNALDK